MTDHTADQPTPAGSATPRDVIAAALDGGGFMHKPRRTREAADAIIAALTASGYRVAHEIVREFTDNPTVAEIFDDEELIGQMLLAQRYATIAEVNYQPYEADRILADRDMARVELLRRLAKAQQAKEAP